MAIVYSSRRIFFEAKEVGCRSRSYVGIVAQCLCLRVSYIQPMEDFNIGQGIDMVQELIDYMHSKATWSCLWS